MSNTPRYRSTFVLASVWALLVVVTATAWVLTQGSLVFLIVMFLAWVGGVVSAELVRAYTSARRGVSITVTYDNDGLPVVTES